MRDVNRKDAGLALLIAASVFLAAMPAMHAYDVAGGPLVIAVSAGVSTVVTFLSGLLIKLRPVYSYAVSLASLAVLMLLVDGPHPGSIADELARGPNRILTETLPLTGATVLLSSLVVLVWTAAAVTSESMVRTPATRVPFGLAVPLALYVFTFAFASSAPTRDNVAGPLLLVTLSVAAVLRARPDSAVLADQDPELRPRSSWHGPAAGVTAAGAIAVVLALALPGLPSFSRDPTRVHRQPPTARLVITDPVDVMGQLRDEGTAARPVNEVSIQMSAPSTGYVGLADLDSYDGALWRFSATFRPSGGRIPGGDNPSHPALATSVTQRIDVTGSLPIPLMPALDRPLRVTGIGADADAVTGMLLPQSRSPGQRDYVVVSSSPAVTLTGLPAADGLDPSAGVAADLAIPPDTSADLATTLRFLATETGEAHPTGSVAFLQSVLRVLQTTERRVDARPVGATGTPATAPPATAPPATGAHRPVTTTTTSVAVPASEGTALSEVIDAVTVKRAATPEQFATFFAMVARYVGVPARLVTGFRIPNGSAGQPVGPGSYVLTDRQAWAWVEVPVAGVGWVVCDPTPDATTAAAVPPPEAATTPATNPPPRQANAVPAAGNETGHPLAPAVSVSVPTGHHLAAWVYAVLAGAGVLALMLVAGPGQASLRRARRRRLRRSADPRTLAVGAWLEVLDGLERAGLVPESGATASEIATEVGHHFGREHVMAARNLAGAADEAVFSSLTPMTYEDALEVWNGAQDLSRRVVAGLDRRQRWRATFLVGSFPATPAGPRR